MYIYIVTCMSDYRRGFELVIRFIEHLQTVTTVLLLIHTFCSSLQHVLSLLSLLSSPVDVPLLLGSCPSRLVAISHQPPTLLTAVSRLSHNHSCSLIYSLGTDCIENTSPNNYSIVASCSYCTDYVKNTASQLLHCCVFRICCGRYLATAVVYTAIT
jgi:hypothetical protein